MTQSDQDGGLAGVTELRRPPVRQSVLVRAGRAETFRSFVTTIGTWWPVQPFSAGKERVRAITIEQQPHGRVYETWDDGTEVDWGTVTDWQPPERFTMTWTFTPSDTEVEFTFTALGPRADQGRGGAPRLGSAVRRADRRGLRAARRLQRRRLLRRLGDHPGCLDRVGS